jgi:hypothetical protein
MTGSTVFPSPVRYACGWCLGPDSNRHAPHGAADFKSAASAIPPPRLGGDDNPPQRAAVPRRHGAECYRWNGSAAKVASMLNSLNVCAGLRAGVGHRLEPTAFARFDPQRGDGIGRDPGDSLRQQRSIELRNRMAESRGYGDVIDLPQAASANGLGGPADQKTNSGTPICSR